MILINQAGSFKLTNKNGWMQTKQKSGGFLLGHRKSMRYKNVPRVDDAFLHLKELDIGPLLSVAGLARFLKQQGQGQKAVSSSGSMLMTAMSHTILYLSFRLGTSWMRFWWRYFRVERKSECESIWLGNGQFFELGWSVDPVDWQFTEYFVNLEVWVASSSKNW